VAPVAIYVLKRKESPFVAFHALQAAFLALAAIPLTIAAWVGLVAGSVVTAMLIGERAQAVLLAGWLGALLLPGLIIAALAIVAGLRALQGERWSIPVLGRIAQGVLSAPER
jgi:uncharacterized membrane protein